MFFFEAAFSPCMFAFFSTTAPTVYNCALLLVIFIQWRFTLWCFVFCISSSFTATTTKLRKTCRGFIHSYPSASSMPSQTWVLLGIYWLSYEIRKLSNINTTSIQGVLGLMDYRQWASCLRGCLREVCGSLLWHLPLRSSMCLLWLCSGDVFVQKR